jgi:amino acid transporter
MKHHYGFYTLTFLVIANMIGAGVFTTSGFSLADLGSPGMVMMAWITGGVIAIAGAASYGMLSRVMPESGGEYLFLSRAVHPLIGYIAGWVSLLAGFSGAIAFAAVTMESYLAPSTGRPDWLPTGSVAILTIALAALIHGSRPQLGAITQNTAVVLKLILFAALFSVAAWQLLAAPISPPGLPSASEFASARSAMENPPVTANSNLSGISSPHLIWAFASSLVWISLSYSGFNAAVYVASEVERPQQVIPRALISGTLLVAVIYILLNAIFVFGAPAEQIAGKEDVAAIAARWIGGNGFENFVRWTIVLCLLTSVFSMMMAAPRVYARMAEDGMLPSWLQFKGNSPWPATVAQAIVAIGLVLLSDLQGLLTYLGLTLSLSAACSVGCLFLPSIRRQLHGSVQPILAFRSIAPAFYIVATLTSATIMTYHKPQHLIGTAVTVLLGAVAYLFVRKQANSPKG